MESIIAEHEMNAKRFQKVVNKLTTEKKQLSNKSLNREVYFERERTKLKLEKRVEVMTLADLRAKEKLEAEKTFSACEGKLINAENELVQRKVICESQKALISQLQLENKENTCRVNELNSRIEEMQIDFDKKSLADSMKIDEMNSQLTQLKGCLNLAEEKNLSLKEIHSRSLDEHIETETILEEVMFKLISFADLYSTMENKFEREKHIQSESLLSLKRKLDETKKKYNRSQEEANSYRGKNEELQQAYDKLKRASKIRSLDKGRKPMGTLAYMNSLQDKSTSSIRPTKITRKGRQVQPKENDYIPNSEKRLASRTNEKRRNFHIKKR